MPELETYRRKRNFDETAEPRGRKVRRRGSSFVVQKHAATRLHYDFRLELDGVLLSWAVPKGPSLDPKVRRLAVQTEDHPLDYGDFEGTIPEGEYGGGTVLLWDRGEWEPEGDPRAQYRSGRLTFTLRGERMKGKWHLVRTRPEAKQPEWLLFKHEDDEASTDGEALVREGVRSVKTERTMDDIREGVSVVSRSRRSRAVKQEKPAKSRTAAARSRKASAAPPEEFQLALATLVQAPPTDDGWVHEMKWDGYRIAARVEGDDVRLFTRNGNDWTSHAPSVARALTEFADNALFDGELVALDDEGKSDFQLLQNTLSEANGERLAYYVFDLLFYDGRDLRELPLEERKRELRRVLGESKKGLVRYSDHAEGSGEAFFQAACQAGLEGIISKKRAAPYHAGRSHDWLKIKCLSRQEFVIGGYTAPSGKRSHLGALHVGVWEDGKLRYSGKVGTGFTQASLRELAQALKPLEQASSPFADAPREAGTKWVKPELVAEVEFTEMTRAGRLRHPTFRGLREDKSPREVRPERAEKAPSTSSLKLTHPDKVLFAEDRITKGQLAEYYAAVAELMLPHVSGRPLTLFRCPEGHQKSCFFQKHAGKGQPEAIHEVAIREQEGKADYLYIDDSDGLLALVQMGVLEIHTWGSRISDVEHPDALVIDLDPAPDVEWERVVAAARQVRDLLERLELESFVKTTGGKGLHVTVPLRPSLDFDQAKSFTGSIAQAMAAHDPAGFVATATKAKRTGKIFVDYLRNARGATFVAPFSTRARAGAPVAVPLAWDDLDRIDPASFRLTTVTKWLPRAKKAWAAYEGTKQKLTAARLKAVAEGARRARA